MRLVGKNQAFILGVLLFWGSPRAIGQTLPWPLDNQNGPHRITGTLGEYRTGIPLHFHDGVDVSTSSTFPSTTVKAILNGTIIDSNNGIGANNNFVTIQSGQYILIYMHVVPSFSTTSIIVGDVIGDIYTASNWTGHIHLEQILGAYDMNTLLGPQSGFRGFSDTDPPVIDEVKLYDPASSTEISISSPILRSEINIRSKAHGDQSWGSNNVGVFEMGYQIVDAGTGQIRTQAYPTQAYARIPTASINNPEVAYDTTSSNNSNYYYFVNKSIPVSAPISLTSLQSGTYKACVLVKDAKDPRLISSCSTFRLDKTKPTTTLRDANGVELFSGGASSMTSINVTSTDTFGLAQIAITGVAPRSVTGLTATETFTGLADGSYTATVTDLAGNVNSNNLAAA